MLIAVSAFGADVPPVLDHVERIVFLGDSITQVGHYVTDIESWLLSRGIQVEVLNLGLSSEVATDLTKEENEAHLRRYGFGRPLVSERLDRVLSATKPDMVVACYGINDGGSLPADASGDKRFAEAVTALREAALKAGAKRVVICTPPVHDSHDSTKPGAHDENLARYSAFIMSNVKDWDVVDIHGPMRRALDSERKKNPDFRFPKDGYHPNREGHWFMAREILTQCFGAEIGPEITSSEMILNPTANRSGNLFASEAGFLMRPGWAAPGTSVQEYRAGPICRPVCQSKTRRKRRGN
jgi:lysophospholipase L1-like esterase